jgi:hypothetical protein
MGNSVQQYLRSLDAYEDHFSSAWAEQAVVALKSGKNYEMQVIGDQADHLQNAQKMVMELEESLSQFERICSHWTESLTEWSRTIESVCKLNQ